MQMFIVRLKWRFIKIYESSKMKKQISIKSSFKPLKFNKKIKIKKSHLDHDRNHDDI